ncbi:putative amidophosphoribosyltransferase [Streptacidiphilus sp. BW17]
MEPFVAAFPATESVAVSPSTPVPKPPLPVRLLDATLDLLLPAACVGCGVARTQLCHECRRHLTAAEPLRARPAHPPPGLPEIYAAVRYGGPARQVLLAHKERGALRLATPLGQALALAARAAFPATPSTERPLLLVPMPSTTHTTRARGHNPTVRVARAAASALRAAGIPTRVVPALRHGRAVADQSGLDAAARQRNLRGALTVHAHRTTLREGHVLVVDDLVTTGASLSEATRALAEAGADVLAGAVVAATQLRD